MHGRMSSRYNCLTLTKGARQLVVQEALEMMSSECL